MSPRSLKLPDGPRLAWYQTARFVRDPHGWNARLRARYGDIITIPTILGTKVVVYTPEGARQLLAGGEDDFVSEYGTEIARALVGARSLFLLSGDRHRRERRLLSPTFHGARMRAYAPAVFEAALRAAESWTVGDVLTMREEMERVSLDVILRAVLGARDEAERSGLGEAIRRACFEINPLPLFAPVFQRNFFGFGPWARFQQHKRELDSRIQALITRTRERDAAEEDVLSRLIAARYEDGSGLSDESVRDQLLTLLIAGHETTATALTWAFFEAGRHPGTVKQLRDEIAGLGPHPDPEDLAQLPYLDAFCKETLRAHPIVAEFFRTVRPGQVFEIQGYRLPAGTHIGASILDIHRDPRLYPAPEIFRPERFLERQFALHEFAAFGGGHRHCLGAAFALNEMKVVMGTLLPRVDLELASRAPARTIFRNVTLGPADGIPMRVTHLSSRAPRRRSRAAP
jgi:cytochrome P450